MPDRTCEKPVSALLIGSYENDRSLIRDVFRKPGWRLFEARDRRQALRSLRRHPVEVVLAESGVPAWSWKKILEFLRRLAPPPLLVVTSRTADDYLWAEVLNFGAFDVLAQPLDRDEVERVIASARRHFDFQPQRAGRNSVSAAQVA